MREHKPLQGRQVLHEDTLITELRPGEGEVETNRWPSVLVAEELTQDVLSVRLQNRELRHPSEREACAVGRLDTLGNREGALRTGRGASSKMSGHMRKIMMYVSEVPV